MSIRWLAFAFALAPGLAACATIGTAADGESISPEQMKLARYVLTGFRDSRSQLRTGEFRYTGTRIRKDPQRRIDHAGEIEGLVAFDFARKWIRFERQEPKYDGEPRGGRCIIKDDDMVIVRYPKSSETTILKPASLPTTELGLFDIRTVGIVNDIEFEMNVGPDELLDEFLPESSLLEAVKKDNLYRLSWKTAAGAMKRSVWFDEDKGFGAVRMESRFRGATDSSLISTCDVTWIEQGGIWVPETLSMANSKRGKERHATYAFDWNSVKLTLDDEMFAVEALQKPGEKVRITDFRLDKPIVVYDPAFPTSQARSRWTVGRVLLVALSTVGLLVGITWLCFLANRRRSR